MTYGTVNADLITTSDGVSSAGLYGLKNRIFNGDMRIDQRNAGASVSVQTNTGYTLDRWGVSAAINSKYTVQQNANSVTPPAGYSNYLGVTSSAATTPGSSDGYDIRQKIEGFNVADLAWGTASAATVTLSFWVRSSLTGTFGGALSNSAFDRSYPFTYTISAANTWEQKSVTIAGDTTGTWLTNNGAGILLYISLGAGATLSGTAGAWAAAGYTSATGATSVVGTNGATFYITGVQLEKGSTATSFDYRPYGTELSLCQRYYYKVFPGAINISFAMGYNASGTIGIGLIPFQVPMRIAPSALDQNGTANNYMIAHANTSTVCSSVPTFSSASVNASNIVFTVASGLTTGQGIQLRSDGTNGATAYLGWSAEL